jgi:hypothetical protein
VKTSRETRPVNIPAKGRRHTRHCRGHRSAPPQPSCQVTRRVLHPRGCPQPDSGNSAPETRRQPEGGRHGAQNGPFCAPPTDRTEGTIPVQIVQFGILRSPHGMLRGIPGHNSFGPHKEAVCKTVGFPKGHPKEWPYCRILPFMKTSGAAAQALGLAPAPGWLCRWAPGARRACSSATPYQPGSSGARPILAMAVSLGAPVSSSRAPRPGRSLRSRHMRSASPSRTPWRNVFWHRGKRSVDSAVVTS